MPNHLPVVCLTLAYVGALLLCEVNGQRSPYAGPRPQSGFNQKDKYFSRPGAVSSVGNGFDSTTTANTNAIAFGAPQRPPMGGGVVAPQANFVPLSSVRTPQFALDNRIGGTDADVSTRGPGFASVVPQLPPLPPQPLPLPLDAHGDQLLIDQLSLLPEDRRPFWFLNYQAIEAQRNGTGSNFAGALASRGSFFG